jgi:hypothetical protein
MHDDGELSGNGHSRALETDPIKWMTWSGALPSKWRIAFAPGLKSLNR